MASTRQYFTCGNDVVLNVHSGQRIEVPTDQCRAQVSDVDAAGIAIGDTETDGYVLDAVSGEREPLAAIPHVIDDRGLIAGYVGGVALLQLPLPPAAVSDVVIDPCATPVSVSWQSDEASFRAADRYVVLVDGVAVARVTQPSAWIPTTAPGAEVEVVGVNAAGESPPAAATLAACASATTTTTSRAVPTTATPRFTG